MRKSTKFLGLVLGLSFSLGLVACGQKNVKNETQKEETKVELESSTEKTINDSEPTKVVFWHSFSGATGDELQKIIDEYNAGQGKEKNISVELIFQGYEGTDKVLLAYQTKDTKNAPDINVGLTSTIPTIMDLDWCVAAQDYMDKEGSVITRDSFYPAMVRSCSMNGKMIGLPFAISVPLLYYNVDFLNEAEIKKAPQDFDELIADVEKLTVKDGNNITRYGLTMQNKRYQLVNFCVSQNENSFFGDNEGGRVAPMTKLTCDDDGTLRTYLEKLDRLVKTGGYKFVEDKTNEEFAQGLSAMVIMSSSRLGTMDGLMKGKYMTAPIPKVNASDTSTVAVGGSCLNIFNLGDEKKVEAAWDVAQYLLSAENTARFSIASGYIPVNKEAENVDIMKTYYDDNMHYRIALEQAKNANPNAQEPFDLTYNDINSAITEDMIEFCNGELTVDSAVTKIGEDCNNLLKEYHEAND